MPKYDCDFLVPRTDGCCSGHFPSEEARAYLEGFDAWHQAQRSAYDELNWTLGAAIKWIAGRSRDAVDRASVDKLAAEQALRELQEALELGEVHLAGRTRLDPVPRSFPPETYAIHVLAWREEDHRLWPLVVHDMTDVEELLDVRLRREEVLRRWPPLDGREPVPASTQGKETACKGWLSAMMRANPNQGRPKEAVWTEARAKYPGLAKRAFDRAWTAAIKDSGTTVWGAPGRPAKIKTPH